MTIEATIPSDYLDVHNDEIDSRAQYHRLIDNALGELEEGGDPAKAQAWATLALANRTDTLINSLDKGLEAVSISAISS